ncbi:hypothetical protein [Longimicrobium sp.]|uniref:hypothetical protein n=1 Tax=Longimicrobium sp. TaxID=2029185 RepID=UPI002E32FE80|nr:hypothetical protein [Longimicrobium sp.]HEX6042161.1 hypothetical protein [Longimicrobium sp.]
MHVHANATPERTQAPAQMLRGVAGSCAPLAGSVAPSRVLRRRSHRGLGSTTRVNESGSSRKWIRGLDRDFGNSVGGKPV